MPFSGKAVIITGSSAGIGQAAAVLFAKAGALLTIHGRSEEKLQQTIGLIEKEGGSKDKVLTVVGEIIDENVQKNLINKTVERFGKIDVLINNAGIKKKESLEDHRSLENFDYIFNVNLRAPVALTELAVPHLEKTKGNIINVSSITALKTQPVSPFYGMTKAALDHFCRNYAVILAPKSIRVNNLSPGATDTEFNPRHGINADSWTKIQQAFSSMIPLGRWASATEMAEFLLFIASDKAAYMTGQMITVDGGAAIAPMGPSITKSS